MESTYNGNKNVERILNCCIAFLFYIPLERSNLFDGGNGVSDDSMSSLVNLYPRQELDVARKSTPSPTPTSPEMDSSKLSCVID